MKTRNRPDTTDGFDTFVKLFSPHYFHIMNLVIYAISFAMSGVGTLRV